MKRLVIAFCGAAALGLVSLASGANATPLTPAKPLGLAESGVQAESVAWRRVCRPVTRWAYGRRIVTTRCTNVWVGPPRGRYYGPGRPGPGPGPGPYYGPRPY